MGMIACAGACVSLSAFGNTTTNWFSVAASDGQLTSTDAVVSGGGYNVAGSKITIDNDYSTAFVVTTNTASPLNDNLVTITSTAVLTPSAAEDLPAADEISEAKVGFAVAYNGAATNYYYYTVANAEWRSSGVAVTDPEGEKTFTITLDYRTRTMSIVVGDSTEVVRDAEFSNETTSFDSVAAFGSGTISSIVGEYEVAVAAYGGTKYGSIAEAMAAATAAGMPAANVQGISSTGEIKNVNETAANGMSYVVCEALGLDVTNADANIAVAPVETDIATNKITLHLTTPTVGTEANLVGYDVYLGNERQGATCNADSIQIPLEAGIYTIKPVLR